MRLRTLTYAARAALLALPALLPSGTVLAGEYARFSNVPIVAERPAGAPHVAPALGLLTLPATWAPGDTAAVLKADPADPHGADRSRLVSDLIGGGVAVLELLLPERQEDRLPILFGALLALSREHGAGRVVALGTGQAGQTVLNAAVPGTAERHVGGREPRFTMTVALHPGCHFGTAVPAPIAMRVAAGLAFGEDDPSCLQRVLLARD